MRTTMWIRPEETIAVEFAAKRPSPTVRLNSVSMEFCYKTYFKMGPARRRKVGRRSVPAQCETPRNITP
jgi:hypothetical protein